jgi:hypothetical protein
MIPCGYDDIDTFLDETDFLSLTDKEVLKKFGIKHHDARDLRRYNLCLRQNKDAIKYIRENTGKRNGPDIVKKTGLSRRDFFIIKKFCTDLIKPRPRINIDHKDLVKCVYEVIADLGFFQEGSLTVHVAKKFKIGRIQSLGIIRRNLLYIEFPFSNCIPHKHQMLVSSKQDIIFIKKKYGYIDNFSCEMRWKCLESSFKFSDNLLFNCSKCKGGNLL